MYSSSPTSSASSSLKTLKQRVSIFSARAQYLESHGEINMERIKQVQELHCKFESLIKELERAPGKISQEIGVPLSTSTPHHSITPLPEKQSAKRKLDFDDPVGPGVQGTLDEHGEPAGPGEPGGGGPQEDAVLIVPWIQKIQEKIDQLNVKFKPDKFVIPESGESFQTALLQQLNRFEIKPLIKHPDVDGLLLSPARFMQELCNYMKKNDDFCHEENFEPGFDWNDKCEDILEPNNVDDVVIQSCARFLNIDIHILDTSSGSQESPFELFKGARNENEGLPEHIVLGKHEAEEHFFISLLPTQKPTATPNERPKIPPSKQRIMAAVPDKVRIMATATVPDNHSNMSTVAVLEDVPAAEGDGQGAVLEDVQGDKGAVGGVIMALPWDTYETIPEDPNTCYVLDVVPCKQGRVLPEKPSNLYKWSRAHNSRPSNPRNRYI